MAVQRVRRVIRKIDPWTVLKVSIIFNAIMALVFVLGTIVFWAVFVNAGIPQRINELALLIGLENGINLEGTVYFRIVILLAVIGTIVFTGFVTLGAVVYNLISDIVGGIEVVVLEETTPSPSARSKTKLPLAPARPKPRGGILPKVRRPTARAGATSPPSPVATDTAIGTVVTRTTDEPATRDAEPRESTG
jgi:hypothetical protein